MCEHAARMDVVQFWHLRKSGSVNRRNDGEATARCTLNRRHASSRSSERVKLPETPINPLRGLISTGVLRGRFDPCSYRHALPCAWPRGHGRAERAAAGKRRSELPTHSGQGVYRPMTARGDASRAPPPYVLQDPTAVRGLRTVASYPCRSEPDPPTASQRRCRSHLDGRPLAPSDRDIRAVGRLSPRSVLDGAY